MTPLVREWRLVACLLLLSTLLVTARSIAIGWEIDATATVTRVVDGDTFIVASLGRVRLADIDTPEVGQSGAREAMEYLTLLVHRKLVLLDIDDTRGKDRYGRVVAVVYLRHNVTHLLNVNEALLSAGLANLADFPNEFDPATWTLYVEASAAVGPAAKTSAAMWMAGIAVMGTVTLGVVILSQRFRGGSRP